MKIDLSNNNLNNVSCYDKRSVDSFKKNLEDYHMNFNLIKNSICGLAITGLLVWLSVPKDSLLLDAVLSASLMGIFIIMLMTDR